MMAGQLEATLTRAVWTWLDVKLFFERTLEFSPDSLHVFAGVVAFLIAAAVIRKPVSSAWPWLVVLVLTCLNEVIDLWVEQWPQPAMQYGESAKDLLLTMALPTLLMLSARLAPGLYRARGS